MEVDRLTKEICLQTLQILADELEALDESGAARAYRHAAELVAAIESPRLRRRATRPQRQEAAPPPVPPVAATPARRPGRPRRTPAA